MANPPLTLSPDLGVHNGDGGVARPHLAPRQAETVHHRRSVPANGFRSHLGQRRRQEADASHTGARNEWNQTLRSVFDWIIFGKIHFSYQVNETIAASNGIVHTNYDDGDDKPVMLLKKNGDHGITALINRQLQGNYRNASGHCSFHVSLLVLVLDFFLYSMCLRLCRLFLHHPPCFGSGLNINWFSSSKNEWNHLQKVRRSALCRQRASCASASGGRTLWALGAIKHSPNTQTH